MGEKCFNRINTKPPTDGNDEPSNRRSIEISGDAAQLGLHGARELLTKDEAASLEPRHASCGGVKD